LIGYSAHSELEAAEAFEQGANYVSLSPIFAPLSKRSDLQPLGLDGLGRACSSLPGPVYALGGVTPRSAASIRARGARGIAAITAILEADDPAAAARDFQESWGDHSEG
jgi:thiamine-phosphate pyrophosphorylase